MDETPLAVKLMVAGASGCIADFASFPLDTAKVRLQIQGGARVMTGHLLAVDGGALSIVGKEIRYSGIFGTMLTIARQEGPKALYNGLSAGLQRQMCFASVRLGLYDTVKALYQPLIDGKDRHPAVSPSIPTRVCAGLTTGALAVLVAQPTDVVKIRFQAQTGGQRLYTSTIQAYRQIAKDSGVKGLWRGTIPNISRNAIINVAEIVCYDVVKDAFVTNGVMRDAIPCHLTSAVIAGFCATVVASPVDVVKTRYMNSKSGEYRGALHCAIKTLMKEGPNAFYKGFAPSFCRLVSWNVCMWVTYEQMKKLVNMK